MNLTSTQTSTLRRDVHKTLDGQIFSQIQFEFLELRTSRTHQSQPNIAKMIIRHCDFDQIVTARQAFADDHFKLFVRILQLSYGYKDVDEAVNKGRILQAPENLC